MKLIKLTKNNNEPILINSDKIVMIETKYSEVEHGSYTAVYVGCPEKALPIRVKESLDTINKKLNPSVTHSVFESCDDRSALSSRQKRLASKGI